MFTFLDPNNRKYSRRDFLTVGSLAGLSLPMLLASKASANDTRRPLTTGKSVIFVMMHGGPSQFETWDPKQDGPASGRSASGVAQTTIPGVHFGATFPKLARHANKLAIVRNYQAENGNHDIKPVVSPYSLNANLGSLYSRVVGSLGANGMPTNVAIFPNSVDPRGPGARSNFGNFLSTGTLGASYAPFVPGAAGQMQQNMTLNLARERLDDRRALLGQIDTLRRQIDASGSMAAVDRFHEQAHDVILSGIARAFDLSREDPRLVAKYNTAIYDRPSSWAHKNNRNNYTAHARSLGKLLLLARRLCEAGCGFVLVNTEFVWDMHQDVNNLGVAEGMDYVGTPFDHALSAYIDDVEARGLGDDILLVATGEMGRTPRLQNNGGRDHWGRLTPLIMHGGGLTHGQVIGQSTRDGGEPAANPQRVANLVATVMNAVFHPGEVRLAPGLPSDVTRVISEVRPIPGLFA
jgi:hypothetical protein